MDANLLASVDGMDIAEIIIYTPIVAFMIYFLWCCFLDYRQAFREWLFERSQRKARDEFQRKIRQSQRKGEEE